MKSANLSTVLDGLEIDKGSLVLPSNRSIFSARQIAALIQYQCPKDAVSIRTIQRAISAIEAPPVQWSVNTPYYDRRYTKAALIYMKFKVME